MKNFTIPNWISLFRILSTPVLGYFILTQQFDYFLYCFIFSALSDVADGLLARLLKQRSQLGAMLDPAGDKLLMAISYFTLAWISKLPFWLPVIVFTRDILIVIAWLYLKHLKRKFEIKPLFVSKLNTFFQLMVLFITAVLIFLDLNPNLTFLNRSFLTQTQTFFVMGAAFFCALSAIEYSRLGYKIYKNK